MATDYGEEVSSYYTAKEKYTELLHKAASDLLQESTSPTNHAPAEEKKDGDTWLMQETKETVALAQLAKELATLMKETEILEEPPKEPESKTKSKGKKK